MSKDIAYDLDKQFETIELINCKDIDVYQKVLMLCDEKTSQNFRSELNHLAIKYIDRDPSLKSKLIENNYDGYDTSSLIASYKTICLTKINKYKLEIQEAIFNNIKQHGPDIFKSINNYFNSSRVDWMADKFDDVSYIDVKYYDLIKLSHENICNIFRIKSELIHDMYSLDATPDVCLKPPGSSANAKSYKTISAALNIPSLRNPLIKFDMRLRFTSLKLNEVESICLTFEYDVPRGTLKTELFLDIDKLGYSISDIDKYCLVRPLMQIKVFAPHP